MKIALIFSFVLIASLASAAPSAHHQKESNGDGVILDLGNLLKIGPNGGEGSIFGARWGWGHGKEGAYGYGGWGPFGGGGGYVPRRNRKGSDEKSSDAKTSEE